MAYQYLSKFPNVEHKYALFQEMVKVLIIYFTLHYKNVLFPECDVSLLIASNVTNFKCCQIKIPQRPNDSQESHHKLLLLSKCPGSAQGAMHYAGRLPRW